MKPEMTTAQWRGEFVKQWSEQEFQQHVITLAKTYGWRVAWFRPVRIQRANGTTYYETPVGADGKGWPDLFLVRGEQAIFAELKRQNGTLEPAQKQWRSDLLGAGCLYYLWKPSDLDEIESVLK